MFCISIKATFVELTICLENPNGEFRNVHLLMCFMNHRVPVNSRENNTTNAKNIDIIFGGFLSLTVRKKGPCQVDFWVETTSVSF